MAKIKKITGILSAIVLIFLSGCQSNQPDQIGVTPTLSPSPQASSSPLPSPSLTLLSSSQSDPHTRQIVQQYMKQLSAEGFTAKEQGLWLQTQQKFLADSQGKQPFSAASLTKVATSLVALKKLGVEHQFVTKIGIQGSIKNGILTGNLIIQGDQDPLFVWEDGILLANFLAKNGLKKVNGNLIIVDKFYMNFEFDPQKSGILLKEAFDAENWSEEVGKQYKTLPPDTPKPQIKITGEVQIQDPSSTPIKPWVNHYSFPLPELLKKMNQYSNNMMADMIGDAVGGANVIETLSTQLAGVSPQEIQLVNASGLSEENRISPRAVVGLFFAIQEYLKPYHMNISDIFTVTGMDPGVLSEREGLPILLVLKSGTLDNVSALGGAIPTQNQGIVWFTILNGGNNVEKLRQKQEFLLHQLLKEWDTVKTLPPELTPNPERKNKQPRNELVTP